MNYTIYIKEKNLATNIKAAVHEYIKRLSPFCKATVCCAGKKKVAFASSDINILITPDQTGKHTISSEAFARMISDYALGGYSKISYFIGFSPDDLPVLSVQTFFDYSMTLSNEICLIAFTEQLYRAYTINNNITYHK